MSTKTNLGNKQTGNNGSMKISNVPNFPKAQSSMPTTSKTPPPPKGKTSCK